MFVQGLVSTKDIEIRRILNKLEKEPNLTLQNLAKDFQRFINVQQDAKDTKVSSMLHIKKAHQENKVKKKKLLLTRYACGELHFYNNCPYKINIFIGEKKKKKKKDNT